MIATIRAPDGQKPGSLLRRLQATPPAPRTRDPARRGPAACFRSRVTNPKWIESMRRHGYKGALELAATVDYLFGYDATAQVLGRLDVSPGGRDAYPAR